MTDKKVKYAKDEQCIICDKQADKFWPVTDPDLPINPYCNECLKKEKIKFLIAIFEPNTFEKDEEI